jgi:hypothetical protein
MLLPDTQLALALRSKGEEKALGVGDDHGMVAACGDLYTVDSFERANDLWTKSILEITQAELS